MKKSCIVYGSTTGTTEEIAQRIGAALGIEKNDQFEVYKFTPELMAQYEVLILGSSTWGSGELQDDWYDGLKVLQSADLNGKTIALFGCGDADSYPDTFCDAIGIIYDGLQDKGCHFIGKLSPDGYSYDGSAAEKDGKLVGLALDEINDAGETDARIARWTKTLKEQIT